MKKRLTSPPVLSLPSDGQFLLDTDASDTTIGAVLSQRQGEFERVLAYGSRRLSTAENYCVTQRDIFVFLR